MSRSSFTTLATLAVLAGRGVDDGTFRRAKERDAKFANNIAPREKRLEKRVATLEQTAQQAERAMALAAARRTRKAQKRLGVNVQPSVVFHGPGCSDAECARVYEGDPGAVWFLCPQCERRIGYCMGAFDETPELCDDCAMKAAQTRFAEGSR